MEDAAKRSAERPLECTGCKKPVSVCYTEIVGDPLWNPDRHTYVKPLRWDANGMPLFGRPSGLDDHRLP